MSSGERSGKRAVHAVAPAARSARTCARVARGVVRAERDDPAVRNDLPDAALAQLADVERPLVLEVLRDDHEPARRDPLQLVGQPDAAGDALQPVAGALGPTRGRGREQPAQRGGHLKVGHGAVGDEAEVAVDVDEPRQGDEVLTVVERVGRRAAGRRAARDRDEVVLAEPLGQLRAQPADHFDVGEPVERIEGGMPSGVRDRLEEDAVDGGMLDAELHDRAEFVLVDAELDRGG